MRKSILFVCLGNICRSPAAEAVFLESLRIKNLQNKFIVDSAGTGGWHVGRLADKRMREAALKRGISIDSKARQICLDDFERFDQILTMDDSNFADVNSLAKELVKPSNTQVRSLMSYSKNQSIQEVPDPYYGGDQGLEEVLDLLEEAIEGLLHKIN